MNTPYPPITVVHYDTVRLIGMKIHTNLINGPVDCSRLWNENFAPRIHEIPRYEKGDAYGVSWVIDPNAGIFDYWATLPVSPEAQIPEGMLESLIPAGLYAQCPISSVKEVPATFHYIYSEWLPKHSEYTVNKDAPCFEHYPADHRKTGKAIVCFPIKKL